MFLGVLGGFRPPNSAKLFLGQPHYSALRKEKKSPQIFFSTADGSKPPPNHFLSKSKLKKVDFWSKKKIDPKLPRNLLCRARHPAAQGSGGAHWCPSKYPTVSKKSKKNVPELHLVAIFCEKKSETVAIHRVTRSKNTLFRLAMPKMACFRGESGKFRVLGVFWAFPLQGVI